MTRYVDVELYGGPFDGLPLLRQALPMKRPAYYHEGDLYYYSSASQTTPEGRLIYRLTHVIPATHPSIQGREQ